MLNERSLGAMVGLQAVVTVSDHFGRRGRLTRVADSVLCQNGRELDEGRPDRPVMSRQ